MNLFNKTGGAVRLLLILSLLSLGACHSGWDKDPFANEGDRIKNAIEPKTKIEKVPPPAQDSLYVNLRSVHTIREGETLKIPVGYKIAHPEVKFVSIAIPGLEAKFPGSSFDSKTNKIVLKAGYDIVSADEDSRVEYLNVVFTTEYAGTLNTKETTIAINVIPENGLVPVIADIKKSFGPITIIAGRVHRLKVSVTDYDEEYGPKLRVFDSLDTYVHGSQFVTISKGTPDPVKEGVWNFDVQVLIPKNFHLPNPGLRFEIEFFAYTIGGIPSRGEKVDFSVYSDAANPRFAVENTIYFTKDVESDYTFTFYDPIGNGKVTGKCLKLPSGMQCNCKRPSISSAGHCTLTWKPATKGTSYLYVEAKNKVMQKLGSTNIATSQKKLTLVVR